MLHQILIALFTCSLLVVFIWLLRGQQSDLEALIDPDDSRQLGQLIGLTGGTIADAAVAQYALERFEKIHGRKATVKDMGIVAGLMKSL